ncbi:ABC transporter ATP-binding protein [Candidatus Venteria ishoeyi]|uniref:Bicarbonate transport ATP-binding protein CmpD n=1 Tax=Candidatus Venteria ishoeyi TaxID=1899563 RepID=A0A1H6F4S0_9GAMM|nr:ABC transporter ATP-binding protein [Candidatus Venteria ishoeyi]MDM8547956.1 ABC transporter ATP-binding protein [Candidatus Venteria ishoeyi]SEH05130.1 Bicarbonate transport ATP-binding protein CmpD [Candidatus Venteria ishoeyi]
MGHILIQDLAKRYQNRRQHSRKNDIHAHEKIITVLEDVNLEFQDGEMVCILGPSGCGKSSLLRIIAGFDRATSGKILIDGQPILKPSSDYIFVFQHNGLLPWMTVWQNVELGLRHLDNEAEKEETIQEYISMVELDGFESYYPHQLSGGMQRRAELARAIVVNPELLIMDEPFSGLDFLTHLKMREEVVNMHQFINKTIVIVTHDIDDALVMADRVVVMGNASTKNILLNRKLAFGHPRNIEKIEGLRELRDELYLMLGVNYAV